MLHLIISKKQLNRAVDRNRLRRRARGALDQIKPDWRRAFSGKLYLQPEMLHLPFPEFKEKIVFLLQKAKIL